MSSQWNRQCPEGEKRSQDGQGNVSAALIRGLTAGLVVVVLALGAWWLLAPSAETRRDAVSTKKGLIKEVAPASAPKTAEEEKVAEKKEKVEKKAPKSYRNLSPKERERQYEKDLAETPIQESTNRTFRTGLEQLISWVFTTELGDPPPPPLPMVSDFDLIHFEEIINLKNEVKDEDSDETAATKQIVDNVKKELKKFIDKGGEPDQFLKYYRDELDNAYQKRKMVQDQVVEVIKGDPSLAPAFLKDVNSRLAEEGIKPVVIPDRMLKRLGVSIKWEQ